ncbi:MAG: hypothetical protein RIA63_01435 [Cyclobacteriaceae bacterium]
MYAIIAIKADQGNDSLYDYNQTIYLDIKFFVDTYVESLKSQAFGYDTFDLNRIFVLYQLVSIREAVALNNHLYRVIKTQGYEKELGVAKRKAEELLLREYREKPLILYFARYIIFLSSKGIWSLLLTIGIIFIVYGLILLPAPSGWIELFEIQYDSYSNIFLVNHVINLVAGTLDLGVSFEIRSINIGGIILLIIGKLLSILLIGNYLVEQLYKRISD